MDAAVVLVAPSNNSVMTSLVSTDDLVIACMQGGNAIVIGHAGRAPAVRATTSATYLISPATFACNLSLGQWLSNAGDLSVAGRAVLLGGLCNAGDLAVGGAAAVSGSLRVGGALYADGLSNQGWLQCAGGASLGSSLAVAAGSVIGGELLVRGGWLSNAGDLAVAGDVSIMGTLSAANISLSQLLSGTLDIGSMTMHGWLSNYGSVSVQDHLVVSPGDTRLNGLSNGGWLQATGDASLGCNLAVLGAWQSNAGALSVQGGATVGGALSVLGGATVGGGLAVQGAWQSNAGALSVLGGATVGSNLAVLGGIDVTGGLRLGGALGAPPGDGSGAYVLQPARTSSMQVYTYLPASSLLQLQPGAVDVWGAGLLVLSCANATGATVALVAYVASNACIVDAQTVGCAVGPGSLNEGVDVLVSFDAGGVALSNKRGAPFSTACTVIGGGWAA